MLTERYAKALQLAWRLHRTQVRKGTSIPYVSHLIAVSSLALEHGANEDEAIAALLHDAVEDAGGKPTLDMIRIRFGDAVADIVAGCTDAYVEPKPDWRPRKDAYLAHLANASASVRLVSASDKLHNARDQYFSTCACTGLRSGHALPPASQARSGTTARWSRLSRGMVARHSWMSLIGR